MPLSKLFASVAASSRLLWLLSLAAAPTTQRSTNGFVPSSREIHPASILRTTGSVTQRWDLSDSAFTVSGPNASVTFDFGQETAGYPTIRYYETTCRSISCAASSFGLPSLTCNGTCQGLGLSYSESAQFAGIGSDQSTFFTTRDGVVYLPIGANEVYTVPAKWGRGGFRYMTLSLGPDTPTSVSVTVGVENLHYTAAPQLAAAELNRHTGHFDCSDSRLNDIWYAGAYTLQLNTIAANTSVNHLYVLNGGGWAQDSTATGLTGADVYLADGAKRDRNPWAGDLSIALRSGLTAQNYKNIEALRNTLIECLILQDTNKLSPSYGYFPYAGSPLGDLLKLVPAVINPYGSDTYHLWAINVFAEYVLVTKDMQFLNKYASQIATGIEATYSFVQTDGLFNGTRGLDWGRNGQGGKNSALNALYFETLRKLVQLSRAYPSTIFNQSASRWNAMASMLKHSFNAQLWDAKAGLYRDNTTAAGSLLHPQDGNAFALEFNLTQSAQQADTIARTLASRLTQYGTPSPELPGSISPFVGSHEVISQFAIAEKSGDPSAALNLIWTQWGYMRRAFSNTTFVEGYGADGSLNYGFYQGLPSFVSHAHAWSTGPVYSLVHDVAGIAATELDVQSSEGDWKVKPVGAFSDDITWAKGGLSVPRGKFEVSWKKSGTCLFELEVLTPGDKSGTIYVPLLKRQGKPEILVNGSRVRYEISGPFARLAQMKGSRILVQVR